jgi:hypothetical protein
MDNEECAVILVPLGLCCSVRQNCSAVRYDVMAVSVKLSGLVECFNPCLMHPVALAINKKNETPLFATVFIVLSILLHVSAYIGHLQVLRIQNVYIRVYI